MDLNTRNNEMRDFFNRKIDERIIKSNFKKIVIFVNNL